MAAKSFALRRWAAAYRRKLPTQARVGRKGVAAPQPLLRARAQNECPGRESASLPFLDAPLRNQRLPTRGCCFHSCAAPSSIKCQSSSVKITHGASPESLPNTTRPISARCAAPSKIRSVRGGAKLHPNYTLDTMDDSSLGALNESQDGHHYHVLFGRRYGVRALSRAGIGPAPGAKAARNAGAT